MATALIDSVLHWRRKLEKDPDDDYILNVIRKLSKVPITLEILEATHIGKTIRKLSKRDDIVGEKAKSVLKKWRDVFVNQGSDKDKLSNDSKKENVNKESKSSSKHSSHEKSVHFQKQSSHYYEHKQKNDSSFNLSEQSSKKYASGNYKVNNSTESSHSLYKYDVKERNSNYLDYDPHTESSEGYDPECPELFPTNYPVKTLKKTVLVETYEPSSVKRKLTDEKEQKEEKSRHKKLKSGSNSISDNAADSKKSSEKKDKHNLSKEKTKENSHSSTLKRELNGMESHSTRKHESVTDKKKKCIEISETNRTKPKKSKVKILSSEEFTSSEVSFEDCLGFNDIVSLKKSSKSHVSVKKTPSSSTTSEGKPTEKSKVPLKTVSPDQKVKVSNSSSHDNNGKVSKDSAVNVDKTKVSKDSSHSNKKTPFIVPKPLTKLDMTEVVSTLPDIQPNYRPLPRSPEFYSPKKKVLTNEDAMKYMSSKKDRTVVYSGKKSSSSCTEVLPLFDICIRVLIDNINIIEYCGCANYDIMKPILERCTAVQLYNIEHYNPNFINDTNNLWKVHCRRDFKLMEPLEHETWRELYWRAHDEREKKLKTVTAHISKSIATSTPVRQVKLAYVDNHGYVKPPRDIAKKQVKNGTAAPINHTIKKSPPKQCQRPPVASNSASTSSSSASSNAFKKPKLAPLMAKTLKSMKALRRK